MREAGARVALLALVACLAGIWGCTKVGTAGAGATARHPYTQPHELRFAAAEDIGGLNPLLNASATEMYLASMTMAYLIKTDSAGNGTVPELITEIPSLRNGGISPDGKALTFHIRHGVRWSDGAPFDADDVVYTTKQVISPANNVLSLDGWDQIVRIDEPDKYTVVYHLKAPYSSFAVTFFSTASANPAVLPKHLLARYASLNRVPYNALPVGIGPFKYRRWKRGDSIEMVPDPLYFRGPPKLQRITFKIIPDRNVTLQQLRTHELDLWLPVSPHFEPEAAAVPGIDVLKLPSYFFDHLDFNLTHPVVADIAVRRALRYGVDRSFLNAKVRNGLYLLSESPVTPASHFHAKLPVVPFNLARGNALLEAAGWRRGHDGVRAKHGMRLAIAFATTTGTPDGDTQIELIRGWWKQLGADIVVKRYLSSQMFALAQQGGIIYGGHFDVIQFGWGADPNEDLSNLYACYRIPPNGQNDPRWCNRAATAAMDAAKTSYDQTSRARSIDFVQKAVYDDVPTIILDARRELFAYSTDLKGWHPNPVAPFDDMLQVDI